MVSYEPSVSEQSAYSRTNTVWYDASEMDGEVQSEGDPSIFSQTTPKGSLRGQLFDNGNLPIANRSNSRRRSTSSTMFMAIAMTSPTPPPRTHLPPTPTEADPSSTPRARRSPYHSPFRQWRASEDSDKTNTIILSSPAQLMHMTSPMQSSLERSGTIRPLAAIHPRAESPATPLPSSLPVGPLLDKSPTPAVHSPQHFAHRGQTRSSIRTKSAQEPITVDSLPYNTTTLKHTVPPLTGGHFQSPPYQPPFHPSRRNTRRPDPQQAFSYRSTPPVGAKGKIRSAYRQLKESSIVVLTKESNHSTLQSPAGSDAIHQPDYSATLACPGNNATASPPLPSSRPSKPPYNQPHPSINDPHVWLFLFGFLCPPLWWISALLGVREQRQWKRWYKSMSRESERLEKALGVRHVPVPGESPFDRLEAMDVVMPTNFFHTLNVWLSVFAVLLLGTVTLMLIWFYMSWGNI
ncbi:hypothetical protein BZG36_02315 [Bifiguratus adelaidae]|uniref:Uncharacterized protein n=1 Tax=Bifiguratus adelaidae TaxID=1938954 RepID=A0A261Y3M9_9FUNG|nr:hypothetical protein BZG36_02315 [Bifiguratus adelaidae]